MRYDTIRLHCHIFAFSLLEGDTIQTVAGKGLTRRSVLSTPNEDLISINYLLIITA